jgi:hypothetical protein
MKQALRNDKHKKNDGDDIKEMINTWNVNRHFEKSRNSTVL